MPGWAGSTRKQELPADWPTIRLTVLIRDGYHCQHVREDTGRRCGMYATDVDHITPGSNHDPSNLQSLCHWHHLRKSGREGGLASQRARRRKTTFEHPGYLP